MSYRTAKATFTGIVEGTTPEETKLGLGPRFRHDKRHETTGNRSFFIERTGGAVWGPITTTQRHHIDEVILTVVYPGQDVTDWDELDMVIAEDFKLLANALLSVPNLDRDNSTIEMITAGEVSILQHAVDSTDDARLLRIAIPFRYRQT